MRLWKIEMKQNFIFLFLFVGIFIGIILTSLYSNFQSFEQKRTNILNELYSAINEAKVQGKYICCIDPPCTMCYMGTWIWKDGSCYCDEMMAKGESDKVCPQCKKGLEEGRCKSSLRDVCET